MLITLRLITLYVGECPLPVITVFKTCFLVQYLVLYGVTPTHCNTCIFYSIDSPKRWDVSTLTEKKTGRMRV